MPEAEPYTALRKPTSALITRRSKPAWQHSRPLLLLVALAAGQGACDGTVEPSRKGEGVSVARLGPLPAPSAPERQRREGDWQITSDRLRLVVADEGGGRPPRGTLVDLTSADAEVDELLSHNVVLYFGAQPVPLRVRELGSEVRDGRPFLRIERRSLDGVLGVWTEISLRAGSQTIELHHRVYNRGEQPLSGLRLGEQMRFSAGAVFVPGEGEVEAPMRASAPFLAWVGTNRSYASVRPAGPLEVECRYDPHGPLDQQAFGPVFSIAPGAYHADHRLLMMVPGGLVEAATAAWSRLSVKLGLVRGQLPAGALPATVEASLPVGGPLLVVRAAANGRFELPLPAGAYRVAARSPGGADIHEVTVEEGRAIELVELLPPRPGFLRFHVRDSEGRQLPARLVVRGVWPTRDPNFGPHHLASGSGNVVYAAEGRGEVPLPGGRFVVTATHGPEYGIAEHRLKVVAGQGRSVRFTLDREVDTMGWVATELHLHAAPSPDSEISLVDRVISLLAEGVEIAVATDHNHVSDYSDSVESLRARALLTAIPGIEVTTAHPHWGHFNVYPYPLEAAPPLMEGLSPAELFPLLRKQAPDGLIQVNHPRMGEIGYFNQTELDLRRGVGGVGYSPDFDAIEIWNGMDIGKGEALSRNLADWFALLNLGMRYTATGSSDSHRLLYQWAGYPRTYVRVADDRPEAVDAAEISRALRQGRALVTSGPFLEVRINGAGPGELAAAAHGMANVQISVRAAAWVDVRRVELVVNGRVAKAHSLRDSGRAGERAVIKWDLEVEEDAWMVVVARGERTLDVVLPYSKGVPAAFTNPVFVDADGDGRFTALGARQPPRDAGSDVATRDGGRDGGAARPSGAWDGRASDSRRP